MSTIEKRQHARIMHAANVKLTNATGESVNLKTYDFSDGGLFLKYTSELIVELGEQATVKVLDIEDALTQKVKVMRIVPGVGIGVEFL